MDVFSFLAKYLPFYGRCCCSACVKTLESGLAIDSTSPDLKRIKAEVNELIRGEQVSSYCNKVSNTCKCQIDSFV